MMGQLSIHLSSTQAHPNLSHPKPHCSPAAHPAHTCSTFTKDPDKTVFYNERNLC